jgi:alcohol dehydrogenase class IV
MWFFDSPHVVFGEDALSYLEQLTGRLAFIVTDANIVRLGLLHKVQNHLENARIPTVVFDHIEPEPSLQTVKRCAAEMTQHQPDWIIGLGGGSCLDAAKTAWVVYENPDVELAGINPFDQYHLREKAHLIAIPTTSGTGSEATWYAVLTDLDEHRKVGVGSRTLLADLALIDPALVMSLPPAQTADTGLDALTHAIESYCSTWHNDFSDGLCLQAAKLIFAYLPRAYQNGADAEAREHLHNAATMAGVGFTNSQATLAHAMGHALGAIFHVPHGRAVALFLPYTIEFTANAGGSRYVEIAQALGLSAVEDRSGAASLVAALRDLQRALHQSTCLRELGIERAAFDSSLDELIAKAETDTQLVTSPRLPETAELRRLFEYAYDGRVVDF